MTVFLGGTCNESTWRSRIIPMLEIGFFDPVVEDWTQDCVAEEIRQRAECAVCLYVITPKMTGVYSIAEVIDDSNKRPSGTIFVRLKDDDGERFTDGRMVKIKGKDFGIKRKPSNASFSRGPSGPSAGSDS